MKDRKSGWQQLLAWLDTALAVVIILSMLSVMAYITYIYFLQVFVWK